MYNKKAYEKYRDKLHSDPIRLEEWLKKSRERHRIRLLNPMNQEKNRTGARKQYEKIKSNPILKEKELKRRREWAHQNRLSCLQHYSNNTMKCACCGEAELLFLEIEHLKGDGNKHRRALKRDRIEEWLIRNNFPNGFGVLCCNCNKGKHLNGGTCPHKSKRK